MQGRVEILAQHVHACAAFLHKFVKTPVKQFKNREAEGGGVEAKGEIRSGVKENKGIKVHGGSLSFVVAFRFVLFFGSPASAEWGLADIF